MLIYNSEIKEAMKFIVNNSGITYYENMLKDTKIVYYRKEIKEIRELFKVWLINYSWNDKDKKFMEDFINGSMYEV